MVESLIDATRDESPRVRADAAMLLATAEAALHHVEWTLTRLAHDDPDPGVRAEAVIALFHAFKRGVEVETVLDIISSDDVDVVTSWQIIDQLVDLDEREPLERQLMAALKGDDARLRGAAAAVCSKISSDAALRAVLEATRDPSPEVRQAAIWGLALHRAAESEEAIGAALHDPHPEVRVAAIFAPAAR
jgi:HEAT repeat protein